MPGQFTLGKKERLKSRKKIEQLFSSRQSFVTAPYRVYYLLEQNIAGKESCLQFGTGVSSKIFKKATDRNRIKRLTREAWRLQKKELQQLLGDANKKMAVFFIYTGKELPEWDAIKQKTAAALNKLYKMINENHSANT